jgi:hypothetical protein
VLNFVADRVLWLASKFGEFKLIAIPAMAIATGMVLSSLARITAALYQFAASTLAVSGVLSGRSAGGAVGKGAQMALPMAGGAMMAAEGGMMRGMFGRLFGGLFTAGEAGLFRGLLGRGLAMVGAAFMSGGWSVLISLVIALVAQFWPNLVSAFRGKGWSTQAGVKAEPETRSAYDTLIPEWVNRLVTRENMMDPSKMMDELYNSKMRSAINDMTSKDVARYRDALVEAANRQVQAFAGMAQRSAIGDPLSWERNRQLGLNMERTLRQLNDTLESMVRVHEGDEREIKRRQDLQKEEERKRRAADNAAAASLTLAPSLGSTLSPWANTW